LAKPQTPRQTGASDQSDQVTGNQAPADGDNAEPARIDATPRIPPEKYPAFGDKRVDALAKALGLDASAIFAVSKAGDVITTIDGQKLQVPA
jgi:hypothetical protein